MILTPWITNAPLDNFTNWWIYLRDFDELTCLHSISIDLDLKECCQEVAERFNQLNESTNVLDVVATYISIRTLVWTSRSVWSGSVHSVFVEWLRRVDARLLPSAFSVRIVSRLVSASIILQKRDQHGSRWRRQHDWRYEIDTNLPNITWGLMLVTGWLGFQSDYGLWLRQSNGPSLARHVIIELMCCRGLQFCGENHVKSYEGLCGHGRCRWDYEDSVARL